MVPRPVSLGLLGCGGIAQTHLEAMARVPRVRLSAVQDLNTQAAQNAAQKYNSRAVLSAEEIFKDPDIDAVLICVPPVTHVEFIKKAIAFGKHALCEKPFTMNVKEAEEIKKLSASSNRLVMMASKFRFVEDVIQARKIVQSGILGEIVMAEVIFCSIVDMQMRWNSNRSVSGGGVLIDNGSHAVDVIKYLVGPIKSVYAQAGKRTQKMEVEDTARLHFETEDRVVGMVDLSWSLYKHTPNYVNIFGTKGTIEVGWGQSQIWNSKEKTSKIFGQGYKKLDAFTRQIEHFADCIDKKAEPILGIEDAIDSVRVIESAYTSIQEKRWLAVRR